MDNIAHVDGCRESLENLELEILSPYAAKSLFSKGRATPCAPCPVRTDFMRDRDRITHCKSFRRLKYKTQVFLSPAGDHYRTRMTHTLEVNQIARTLARALRLNEDLTDAIALGHDLGHTPFGHMGEGALNDCLSGGFEHNVQSLRVVEHLENGTGLNLTFEVKDGILNHKKSGKPQTLEGEIVSLADRIAYINHDIDDAVRAGVLKPSSIPMDIQLALGTSHGERINTLIVDVLTQSANRPHVTMSAHIDKVFSDLRTFMFENVYFSPEALREEGRARHIVTALFEYYFKRPDALPEEFKCNLEKDGSERVAADYIACMTDRYAVNEYMSLFVPKSWA